MAVKKRFTPSIYLTGIFVLCLFLLFFIAALSFRQINRLSDSQDSMVRSLEIRVDLEKLFSELKDAEAAHRGYLITLDKRYLEPFNYSRVKINKSLLAIRGKIDNNQQRQKEYDILSRLINERFRGLMYNLSESRLMDTSSDDFREKMWHGNVELEKIRQQINKIVASEENILSRQESKYADEISFTPFTSVLLVFFSLLIFLYTFRRINKNLADLNILNHELQLVNETFGFAERIGEVSHWEYDPESETLTFSDNKFNLLGFKPNAFVPSVEHFLQFVHPQDRKKVRHSFVKEMNSESFLMHFRIIRKDKKIRHIKSISKLTTDSKGKEIIIGVDCDVTIQHRNVIKLEQKNTELKRSNDELVSFNHIASHDLQEPLRKIQMFISRIDEDDKARLSESGQGYMEKIQITSSRAQKLIDDLLVYSRLNRNDKNPEMTDLNLILEEAKNDLAQVIEDKNAEITSDKLPLLKVIPHQIQQLFVNLISNSLKYSKQDETPKLTISYKLVSSRRTPELKKRIHKNYHQITFTDNGIGFDQQYSERIFVLFHRLHDKDDYSGTGIGLAISKKMAENHTGFIFAYGEPNVGATFKVFLPA